MIAGAILESGMHFGPYAEGQFFYIEKSETYKRIEKHVQIAEFLLIQEKKGKTEVWVVEAKSSSPRPGQQKFDDYIIEIYEKLVNGLSLGIASCLRRHSLAVSELPDKFNELDMAETGFQLILVINGHEEDWLAPLQDALSNKLRPIVKTWALSPNSVHVINDQMAKKFGLII